MSKNPDVQIPQCPSTPLSGAQSSIAAMSGTPMSKFPNVRYPNVTNPNVANPNVIVSSNITLNGNSYFGLG